MTAVALQENKLMFYSGFLMQDTISCHWAFVLMRRRKDEKSVVIIVKAGFIYSWSRIRIMLCYAKLLNHKHIATKHL